MSNKRTGFKRDLNLYERIRARFAPLGGVDLELPPREPARDPPDFDTADYDRPPTDRWSGGVDGAPVTPPDWLQKAWAGAKRRGLDAMTVDEINTEIDAVRAEGLVRGKEDDA